MKIDLTDRVALVPVLVIDTLHDPPNRHDGSARGRTPPGIPPGGWPGITCSGGWWGAPGVQLRSAPFDDADVENVATDRRRTTPPDRDLERWRVGRS